MQICPTLLKGISISDQHYPIAHLRPMGDIDILIPADAYESVESALLHRGYARKPGFTVSKGAVSHPRREVGTSQYVAPGCGHAVRAVAGRAACAYYGGILGGPCPARPRMDRPCSSAPRNEHAGHVVSVTA